MARKRETRSSEFKAKVALEALREESTLQELAVKYQVHVRGKMFLPRNGKEFFLSLQ